jgi:hypothetical protein
MDWNNLAYGSPVTASCENGTVPLDSVRGRERIDQLSNYQRLKKNTDLWSKLLTFTHSYWASKCCYVVEGDENVILQDSFTVPCFLLAICWFVSLLFVFL